jgi:protein phosphatase
MAELPTINLALYAQTDVGMVRSGNEDNFLILDLSSGKSWTASEEEPKELLTYTQGYYGSLLAVSDGMGGALAGEVASRMAVETVRDRMLQLQAHETYGKMPFYERLRLSIEEANLLINGESQTNPAHKGLGATFTGVAVHGNQIYFAQVGDSRAYLLRQGKIVRITKDQSLVQQLIDAGQITEEEAETHSYRNVILQALGAHNNVNVEVNCLTLSQLDTLVLCSDGLSGKIHQDDIARVVHEANDFKSACQTLIDLANERGGEDNITVVIAQLSGVGLTQPLGDPVDPQTLARSPDTPTEINWGLGAKTDSLNSSTSSSDDGHTKATEPLPTPPMQSMPFTSKLPRNSPDTARTNDLSDRRGPITSVFAPGDFEDEPEVSTVQKPAQVTTPLEQRQTQPLAATTNQPAAANTAAKAPPSTVNHNPVQNAKTAQTKKQPDKNGSRMNTLILAGLLVLGVAGLVIGVTSYLKRQEQVRTAQEQALLKLQIENQNQKEGQIGRLREKIAEINKRLQMADKPMLKERRDLWHRDLNNLSMRLDDVAKISSDHLQQINQACDEIGKELKKIEDEVNNLQGLLPSHHTNREPIKV